MVHSQGSTSRIDSLRLKFSKDSAWIYRPKKVFPLVAIDQRNSFLKTGKNTNDPINIWGLKLGVTLYDRHNLGFGGYSIQASSKRQLTKNKITVEQSLTFRYATLFYEYSFVQNRWWEIGVPLELGVGGYRLSNIILSDGQHLPDRRGQVFPMGAGLDVYFIPYKWFALNAMGGYRYVINNTSRLDLSGWFYSFGGAVYFRQILQDTRYFIKKRKYKKAVKDISSAAQ